MSANPQRRRSGPLAAAIACVALLGGTLPAAPVLAANPPGPVMNSPLDAPLFYQLLLGEMELRNGAPGTAFQVLLDAARRTKDEALFRRAVDIAIQARAGEQALSATSAWRTALPASREAMRYQLQLLVVLNRVTEAMDPLGALLQATPADERPGLIASLPRFFQRAVDRRQAATLLEHLLKPYLAQPATRTAARVALGRMALLAEDAPKAREWAQAAHADDPQAPGPALLAMELMDRLPEAETLLSSYLSQPKADAAVRAAYVQVLTARQRYGDALVQAEALTKQQPELAPPWLTLGALRLELRQPEQAEQALQRYVQLLQQGRGTTPPGAALTIGTPLDDDDDDALAPDTQRGLVQAQLLLAQAAEMRGDFKTAEAHLAKVDSPQRALEVQGRRAALLARQGKVNEARELIRKLPEQRPEDARAKLVAEAQVLRDVKRWREASQVMSTLNQRFPDDADLLYEQAMVEEKLDRLGEMERLLRRVIALKPDHHHAYNALGYSLADRNVRLPEAKELIEKALTLAPGDPFITDSLGWVLYRMGQRKLAIEQLRKAYTSRPDTEIAAHLAEVLWMEGQRDEARRLLRDARQRDSGNEVLSEVIARLKVDL